MPVSAIVKYWRQLCLLLLVSTAVQASNFTILSAQIDKIGNDYVLNATINYSLSPEVKEAIEHGVPIVFLQQFELIENTNILGRFWQWQETLWSTELRYELRYHALSQQFILQSIDTGHRRNFLSLDSAVQMIGDIDALSLPSEYLDDTDDLILQLRSGLDLHALPTPLRPGAVISNNWQLTSSWVIAPWP